MDRKAWIVIILCALGIGANQWYAGKLENERRQWEAAHPKADDSPASAAGGRAEASLQPAATANTPAPAGAAPEETRELSAGSVTYIFTTRGGGVRKAILGAQDQITLNTLGRDPVGAIRRDPRIPDQINYKIVESTSKSVVFEGTTSDNVTVRKAYSLSDGEAADDHLLKLVITLTNAGTGAVPLDQYYLYAGAASSLRPDDIVPPSVFWNNSGDPSERPVSWFGGGWFSSEKPRMDESAAQLRFSGVASRFYVHVVSHITKPLQEKAGRVWAERFLVDHSKDEYKDTKTAAHDYAIESASSLPSDSVAAGASETLDYELYLGPREYHRLQHLGHQREQVMFYGRWVGWVSIIFVNLLRWLQSLVGSWGWSIILMTIIVRLCTWPVFASSMKQAKRMGKLAPLMKEIQEKYKDEPQKQSEETMKLYKDYGFNPLGCVMPMILQILIFTGFFGVLKVAAELRGQPFWWVHDLSLPDTVGHFLGFGVNLLPILMGLTSVVQMKLTPQSPTADKSQQRMMMLMPFVFVFFCYNSQPPSRFTTPRKISLAFSKAGPCAK